ncbi:hypothetical protein K438DRAFT_1858820 [Mycena galopus ATCC 62051]|nr:hypothetical protein K438DRAFT_1858820 [Mycena galopus ATCC 62051]
MGTAAVLSAGVEERGAAWKNPRRGRGDYRRRGGRRAIEVLERAAGCGSVLALRLTRPRSTRVAHAAGRQCRWTRRCSATRSPRGLGTRRHGEDGAAIDAGRHGLQRLEGMDKKQASDNERSIQTHLLAPARPRLKFKKPPRGTEPMLRRSSQRLLESESTKERRGRTLRAGDGPQVARVQDLTA